MTSLNIYKLTILWK